MTAPSEAVGTTGLVAVTLVAIGAFLLGAPKSLEGPVLVPLTHDSGVTVSDLVAVALSAAGIALLVLTLRRRAPNGLPALWSDPALAPVVLGLGLGLCSTVLGDHTHWLWIPGGVFVAAGLARGAADATRMTGVPRADTDRDVPPVTASGTGGAP